MTKVIIFDFNGTLYDPETKTLFEETMDILNFFKNNGFELYLYSRGKAGRNEKILRCGIEKYFQQIDVVEEKKIEDFEYIQNLYSNDTQFYVVGDCLAKEIQLGGALNMKTVWIQQGKFASQKTEDYVYNPDFVVHSLQEIFDIL